MKDRSTPNLRRLRERAELLKKLRLFFDQRGFLEVQPPCLTSDCVIDAYIDPLRVDIREFQLGSHHGGWLLQGKSNFWQSKRLP